MVKKNDSNFRRISIQAQELAHYKSMAQVAWTAIAFSRGATAKNLLSLEKAILAIKYCKREQA
jgi:hypothetical protein